MHYGIRLTGTEHDLGSLHTLADGWPDLVVSPWTELSAPSEPGSGSVITSAKLDISVAQGLQKKGVDVVRVTREGDACQLMPLRVRRAVDPGTRWEACVAREAPSLVEALRPVRVVGDAPAAEVIFRVALDSESAQRTIERLLSLRRDDFTVAEMTDRESNARVLLVRVPTPPMYLLLRSREEPGEDVTAFARTGDGDLWVEWGYAHPLSRVVARLLKGTDRMAFVDRAGRWRFAAANLPVRSVYDVVVPRFEAARVDLEPAPGGTRFRIRLRLGSGPVGEPELWLLDAEQFLALEPLVESLTQEEVTRFTVARTTGPEGTRYVLQEIVRPNVSRLGVRVTDLAAVPGYVRSPGTDNLFLPAGRQLLPRMRRDELRALLELDRARAVVITEDADGPRVVHVRTADEAPLSRWVDYVSTDRRMELERLAEESVFDWPELSVERPPRPREKADERAGRGDAPSPPKPRRQEARRATEAPEVPATVEDDPTSNAALREEIRVYETALARGGVDDAAPWGALGDLKVRAHEYDDAAACIEAEMFYGAASVDRAASLGGHRARLIGAAGTDKELVELVTKARLSPGEASYLGARVVEKVLRGDAVLDGFFQQAERVFTDPETPVSRRLAWTVASALHRRANDRLGVTRARERVLGGMNDRGLAETSDMPRFVRFALAFEAGESTGQERVRHEQLQALEQLWSLAQHDFVKELDAKSAYLRLIFSIGFVRLGAPSRARDVMEPVQAEEDVHEAPNRILFRLYRARYAHVATQGDAASWAREVDGILATVKEARVKDRVEWLRKRSEWLRSAAPDDAATGVRTALEKALAEAEESPERAPATLAQLMEDRALFDYEVRIAVERSLRVGLRSGNDELLADVLRVAVAKLQRVTILGHRAGCIGVCIRAAATIHDNDTVDRLLDEVVALAGAPDVPSARDLLMAVGPGLAALRRLGVGASARRFLEALVPVAARGQREGVKLRAALADGFLQLKETERAQQLIDQCLDDTLEGSLDHPGRYDAGVAVLAALKHWPMAERTPRCLKVLHGLDKFTDAFTASLQRLYETHKILIAERVVDAVADDVTFQGDRVRAFLDEEEQAIRRRIIADWRDVCGR